MKKILSAISIFFVLGSFAFADSTTRFVFTDTLPAMDGGDDYTAFELRLTNSNHTGTGNEHFGFRVPNMMLNANSIGVAFEIGQGWHYGLHLGTNLPILFGPIGSGTQLYFDGNILSISGALVIYGDLSLNDKALKDFDKLSIKNEDLSFGFCDQDQVRIDAGGATKELCYCDGSDWLCTPLRQGPVD